MARPRGWCSVVRRRSRELLRKLRRYADYTLAEGAKIGEAIRRLRIKAVADVINIYKQL